MKFYRFLPLILVLMTGACTGLEAPPAATLDAAPTDAAAPENQSALAVSRAQLPMDSLLAPFAEPAQAQGDVVLLYGQVLEQSGAPLSNLAVEIWQTDAGGVYDHPNDPGTNNRDTTFQFYGTAVTDDAGWYAFRTILPGEYEPRPRHIHYKVKEGDETLLTSQFYFRGAVLDDAAMASQTEITTGEELLQVQLIRDGDILLANAPIVIRKSAQNAAANDATLPLTPAQTEGPYYPVVALTDYDNDLTAR